MAKTSPPGFDVNYLREQVQDTYSKVAIEPGDEYHFHCGPEYAAEYLNYDLEELKKLPVECTARFAGVGNPHLIGSIKPGDTVLDHACGAGMDLLLAAKCVGSTGKVIGVDMTPEMRECAALAAEKAGLSDIVDIRAGLFEELPVDDESVDVLISNGVLNLSPDKEKVFQEIYRVLKPGGKLYLADVIVKRELTIEARSNPDIWAACIGGAMQEHEIIELATDVGMTDCRVTDHFDCFRNTPAMEKVSKDLQVQSANFYAKK